MLRRISFSCILLSFFLIAGIVGSARADNTFENSVQGLTEFFNSVGEDLGTGIDAMSKDAGQLITGSTRDVVPISRQYGPGTIIVKVSERKLYYILSSGRALRYGVGVGREGFQWGGESYVSRKQEWPDWRPPKEMIERERVQNNRDIPEFMPGGPDNPLGARALYLGQTLYRIHGTNESQTIGRAVSSGCIRMRNEDVIDLYERVSVGSKVYVYH